MQGAKHSNAQRHCEHLQRRSAPLNHRNGVDSTDPISVIQWTSTSGSEGKAAAAIPIAMAVPSTGRPSRYCTATQAAVTAKRLNVACSAARAMMLSLNRCSFGQTPKSRR
jgi:hypothetical protein